MIERWWRVAHFGDVTFRGRMPGWPRCVALIGLDDGGAYPVGPALVGGLFRAEHPGWPLVRVSVRPSGPPIRSMLRPPVPRGGLICGPVAVPDGRATPDHPGRVAPDPEDPLARSRLDRLIARRTVRSYRRPASSGVALVRHDRPAECPDDCPDERPEFRSDSPDRPVQCPAKCSDEAVEWSPDYPVERLDGCTTGRELATTPSTRRSVPGRCPGRLSRRAARVPGGVSGPSAPDPRPIRWGMATGGLAVWAALSAIRIIAAARRLRIRTTRARSVETTMPPTSPAVRPQAGPSTATAPLAARSARLARRLVWGAAARLGAGVAAGALGAIGWLAAMAVLDLWRAHPDTVSQVWVTVFGLPALFLCLTERRGARRVGVLLGLVGQPGWYAQLLIHGQWGMFPVFLGYTGSWLWGLWNLWGPPSRSGGVRSETAGHGSGSSPV